MLNRPTEPQHVKQVLTDWVRDCKGEEEKAKRLATLVSAIGAMKVLVTILEKKKESSTISFSDYDSPSWSHKMADQLGYHRAISEVTKLIESLDNIDLTIKKD